MIARIFASALVTISIVGTAMSQPPAMSSQTATIKRIPLQKFEVPGTDYETVIGIAEIAPNVSIGRHTHPGPESGYMLDGEMVLIIEGQPDKTVRVGESYQVPPGAVHDARTGPQGAKVIATYVVERGKPVASPAK